jgi:DNA-binding transcriptional ArsR family regulator
VTLSGRRVTDAAALKALAHPVRTALLSALVARGPLTASQAAALVEESPSNCSWHLRKLAEHGFVREARGRSGRERPWQAVREGLVWGSGPDDAEPAAQLAEQALDDTLVERELQRLRAARASRAREPRPWREATGLLQAQLWLTAEEAAALVDDVRRLVAGYQGRAGSESPPPDVRLVSVVGWLVPSGPHRPALPPSGNAGS